MKPLSHLVFGLALLFGLTAEAAAPKPSHQQIEQNTRLQIFLDNANFGPGKIDGQQGEFTKKALALYRQANGLPAVAPAGPKAPMDTTGLDLSGVEPVFTSYTITADDLANVGELPSGPAAQAKVKRLPYATVAEGIAEKFHCDLKFFKDLNPKKTEKLKAGDPVSVPNVKPFEMSAVKDIRPGSEAKALIANELGEDNATQGAEATDKTDEASGISLHIGVKDGMLEVMADGKIAAAFPVTVGSKQTVSPVGHWKVKGVAKLPNFRYDPLMLKKGERGSDFHMLPPGPNNPVGVMWIALNKKGIGIHGTNDPDSIGRASSHGCIRLANWDVVKLAEMVKTGVPVTVDEASPLEAGEKIGKQ
ncbi:MAG: L,D-transpeptidase family protein [Chthoniobacter sp.]|uniref:L,D-transpeptidase family protein n=1 Tax=Chthoniobacter sp. TaxID=2510640 RepID=UPI0032A44542